MTQRNGRRQWLSGGVHAPLLFHHVWKPAADAFHEPWPKSEKWLHQWIHRSNGWLQWNKHDLQVISSAFRIDLRCTQDIYVPYVQKIGTSQWTNHKQQAQQVQWSLPISRLSINCGNLTQTRKYLSLRKFIAAEFEYFEFCFSVLRPRALEQDRRGLHSTSCESMVFPSQFRQRHSCGQANSLSADALFSFVCTPGFKAFGKKSNSFSDFWRSMSDSEDGPAWEFHFINCLWRPILRIRR